MTERKLVGTEEMFKKALKGGYAIGAFNCNNMEIVQAITEAAKECNSPVILQVSAGARKYAKACYLKHMVEAAVEDYNGNSPLRLPDGTRATIEQYLNYLANLAPVETATTTNSKCIFRNSKLRSIDAFTLDYMYEEE